MNRSKLFCFGAITALSLTWLSASAQNVVDDWKVPSRKARIQNPLHSSDTSVAAGRELFMVACAPCHGKSGRGDGEAAASLERKPGNLTDASRMGAQSDGELFWKISVGRSPMPSFEEMLNEEQRWQIVTFVRTLAIKKDIALANPSQE